MKKLFPLFIVTMVLLLMFAGVAGAVVTEEPIEVEEGMAAITSVEEPLEEVVEGTGGEVRVEDGKEVLSDNLSGEGVEGEVTITGIDGREVPFDGTAEEAERIRTLGYADLSAPGVEANSQNFILYYVAAAAAALALMFFAYRKKTSPATK